MIDSGLQMWLYVGWQSWITDIQTLQYTDFHEILVQTQYTTCLSADKIGGLVLLMTRVKLNGEMRLEMGHARKESKYRSFDWKYWKHFVMCNRLLEA
jgi:hypothetical protein